LNRISSKHSNKRVNESYVITRWYRAPEVLLSSAMYTEAVDIWSAGCILAELIGRVPLFKGGDYMDQFLAIVAVMGKPKP
jgi:mitogen-activated protein kinase 7